MVQQHTVTYLSDLSGKPIEGTDSPTVAFGWDGTDYTIDLTADEAEKFHRVMEKYLSVATKTPAPKASRSRRAAAASGPTASEIRTWARANGYEVPDRGRIPTEIREAYEAAS